MPALLSITRTSDGRVDPVWPLSVPLIGLPLWWVLGVWQFMFLAMAVPMLVYLIRQRSIAMPRGFGLWLAWLAWLLTGVFVLQVDAPFAVPGANMNRYLSFAFRYAWYLAATIVVLYVVNTRRALDSQRIVRAVAWLFVWLVAGGLLGLAAPEVDLPSVAQVILPDSLANNSFIYSLTRIQAAQVQDVLGSFQPRPSAPFVYTNEWGFATAISLPFFVAAWWQRDRRWRFAMVCVLSLGLFAILASLNRGIWIALLAVLGLVVVQSALQGRFRAIAVAVTLVCVAAAVLLFSPLGELVSGRLDNGRSDEVRGNLAFTAIESAAQGSPIVGFGSTRDVAGTFSSIAGGSSEACPRCHAPPLGTHGQMWLVIFGSGFVGAVLFGGFLASQFIRTFRARSTCAVAASGVLLMLLVTLPFYNSVGIPLYLGLLGLGLLARESRRPLASLEGLLRPLARQLPALAVLIFVGGLAGQGVHMVLGAPHVATSRVLVPATELVPVPGVRASTLDSEAALVQSTLVVEAVAVALDVPSETARAGIAVGAEPNTRVLLISYESNQAETAQQGVEVVVATYMELREALLADSSALVRERYLRRQEDLDAVYRETRSYARRGQGAHLWDVLASTEKQWVSASNILLNADDGPPVRVISHPTVATSSDARMIRVSTGLGIGLLAGLVLVLAYDRRYLLLGRQAGRRLGEGVPVVATIRPESAQELARVVRNYAPVAGVVADPDDPVSRTLVTALDRDLPSGTHEGRRTVIVVDRASKAGRIRRLVQDAMGAGVDPVGLILRERVRSEHRNKHG